MNKNLIMTALALITVVSCKETKSPFTRSVSEYAVVTIEAPDLSGITDNGKEVLNLYRFAADEVVEVYVKDEASPDAPAHPVLAGFARVSLGAGEEREDSFLKDCPVSLLEAASVDAAEVYSLPTLENEQLMEAARRRYRGMERIALN